MVNKMTMHCLLELSELFNLNFKSTEAWKVVLYLQWCANNRHINKSGCTRKEIYDNIHSTMKHLAFEKTLIELESKNIITCWRTVGKQNYYQIKDSTRWSKENV
jgi:hypothetical protein